MPPRGAPPPWMPLSAGLRTKRDRKSLQTVSSDEPGEGCGSTLRSLKVFFGNPQSVVKESENCSQIRRRARDTADPDSPRVAQTPAGPSVQPGLPLGTAKLNGARGQACPSLHCCRATSVGADSAASNVVVTRRRRQTYQTYLPGHAGMGPCRSAGVQRRPSQLPSLSRSGVSPLASQSSGEKKRPNARRY